MKSKVKSFFRKKLLYIVTTVIFSLLLLASLVLLALVPANAGGRGGMAGDISDMASMDTPDMADGDFSGMDGTDRTEGANSGEMPARDEAPGGFGDIDSADSTGRAENGEMRAGGGLDDADLAGLQDMSEAKSGLRILQRLRAAALPLLIISALLDAGSIFMLVWISWQERKAREVEETALLSADGQVHLAISARSKNRRKQGFRLIWLLPLVILALLAIVVRTITSMKVSPDTSATSASVLSGTVESGKLETTLPGAGTLIDEDAVSISLPSEVEVTAWHVSNGDTVTEGDLLASVDLSTVMTAIATVQASIVSLDEEAAEEAENTTTVTVTAAADGRVKAVYASEDTAVADTIYESGALLVLSLDGMMQVTLEDVDGGLSAGDSVTVALSDGTEVTGKVEQISGGTAVVTLSDDGPEIGESVAVTAADGTDLGSGTLSVHSALLVTGYVGVVEAISVSVEDEVETGDTLLTLTDAADSARYETLLLQRAELEQQLRTLFKIYREGGITAPSAGIISGIASSSTSSGSGSSERAENDEDAAVNQTSAESDSGIVLNLLTATSAANASAGESQPLPEDGAGDAAGSENSGTGLPDLTGSTSYAALVLGSSDGILYLTAVEVAVTGSTDCSDLSALFLSALGSLDELELKTLDVATLTAEIYIYSNGALTAGSLEGLSAGDAVLLSYSDDSGALSCIILNATAEEDGTIGQEVSAGSQIEAESDTQQTETDSIGGNSTGAGAGGQTGQGNTSGSDAVSNGTDTDALDTGESGEMDYSVSETTLVSVTPQNTMDITITVDELDILLVELGQTARVTLDAIPGQSFEGIVTAIDYTGNSSDGNTKFTVTVTISREGDMLSGMNASVKLVLDIQPDVLTLPVEALVEEGAATCVYTTYDEKTDTLGGLTEVTTGASDGLMVEITSGLSQGDTYFYRYLDTVNYSVQSVLSGSSFSFGSLLGGGR